MGGSRRGFTEEMWSQRCSSHPAALPYRSMGHYEQGNAPNMAPVAELVGLGSIYRHGSTGTAKGLGGGGCSALLCSAPQLLCQMCGTLWVTLHSAGSGTQRLMEGKCKVVLRAKRSPGVWAAASATLMK